MSARLPFRRRLWRAAWRAACGFGINACLLISVFAAIPGFAFALLYIPALANLRDGAAGAAMAPVVLWGLPLCVATCLICGGAMRLLDRLYWRSFD